MDRRSFLRTLIGGVAGAAAVRTWPFRVFSFPAVPALSRVDMLDLSKWGRKELLSNDVWAISHDGGLTWNPYNIPPRVSMSFPHPVMIRSPYYNYNQEIVQIPLKNATFILGGKKNFPTDLSTIPISAISA